ncbi:MAG: SPOR domain-containing protein [Bacteroidales bacterium]|nr:SPOR domain-containing protein [Bacteroidales bacterium]
MEVAKYLRELLYDYECVIIPNLGGFISNNKPVTINKLSNRFSPPNSTIHFNTHLKTNDGLLLNHLSQRENIDYATSKIKVEKFVRHCKTILDNEGKIHLKSVGYLFYDKNRNIGFSQDEKINFNADSYGLTDLVSPSIKRITDEEKVKKVIASALKNSNNTSRQRVSRKSNRGNKSLATQLLLPAILIFTLGIGYAYIENGMISNYIDRYSSQIPFFYSSVNDYLAENINSEPVGKLSKGAASFFPIVLNEKHDTEAAITKIKSPEETTKEEIAIIKHKDIQQPNGIGETVVSLDVKRTTDGTHTKNHNLDKTLSSNKFFIIAGSFSKKSNALNLINSLKSNGFDAIIADTSNNGMYRVAFESFSLRSAAKQELVAIRKNENPNAWLLVK